MLEHFRGILSPYGSGLVRVQALAWPGDKPKLGLQRAVPGDRRSDFSVERAAAHTVLLG